MNTQAIQVELQPVTSSRMIEVGYNEETATLGIRFTPTRKCPAGALYYYDGFPEPMFEEFLISESLGAFFSDRILNNPAFPYRRIDENQSTTTAFDSAGAPFPVAESVPVLELPDDEDGLRLRALEVKDQITALVIITPSEYEFAGKESLRIRAERKEVEAKVNRIYKPAYEAYVAARDLRDEVLGPYDAADKWIDSGLKEYRRREAEERRRLDEERAAEARRVAMLEAQKKSQELAEHDAKIFEAQGQPDLAAHVRSNPLPVAPRTVSVAPIKKEVPKVEGLTFTKVVRFVIEDESLVPNQYRIVDERKIRRVVDALGMKAEIPGVRTYEDEISRKSV